MRLTNVSQMHVQPGMLFSCSMTVHPASLDDQAAHLPVSFDQARHVGFGSRPGSWMAVAFFLPQVADRHIIAEAWQHVIARHGTLRSVFTWKTTPAPADRTDAATNAGSETELNLSPVSVCAGDWQQLKPEPSPVAAGFASAGSHRGAEGSAEPEAVMSAEQIRAALRAHFDAVCDPFGQPSYRLCVIEDPDQLKPPQIVIGADHAHVDAWSLLVLARDLSAMVEDLLAGREPGAQLPEAEAFSDHSALLDEKPLPPQQVLSRWQEILEAGGDAMPTFPLNLGDLSTPVDEMVEIRDVFDAEELAYLEAYAASHGVRLIAVAISVMTRLARELSGCPFRAVFPVHSRENPRWFNSVGWFITNSVLENDDEDYRACYSAVKEAIKLGSYPLAPIMRPYGGMPQTPGMFAMSWLDHRKLPVNVDEELNPQHVSAVIRTDGVMIWFVINGSGLHLRCRYPNTRQARRAMRTWLAGLVYGLRAPLERGLDSA